MHRLEMHTRLPGTPAVLFPFFADAANLEKITPGELGFRILTPGPIAMGAGVRIDYRIGLWGVPLRWRTRIETWDPPQAFSDVQERGPYRVWRHLHLLEEDGTGGTLMTDRVDFELSLEPFSRLVLPLVKLQLRRIFTHRDGALRRALGVPAAGERPRVSIVRIGD
ncbi:MAG: SRPBCC family protein [Fibrobacteria bacterium]|nr:SRPBCC family protein [Fibrobacteria bacterium]